MLGERKKRHEQETFSCKTTFFKMDPSARKLQESGNKQNKFEEIKIALKICTLATNKLILNLGSVDC